MTPPESGCGCEALLKELRHELLTELRSLRLAVERPSLRSLSRADRAALEQLLPAVTGVFGSELVLAADIAESTAPSLQVVRGDLNTKRIGKLFSRAAGTPIAGLVIERVAFEAGAVLWRVVELAEFPKV